MTEVTFNTELPLDDEGYLLAECPECRERLGIHAGELEAFEPDGIACPYCEAMDHRSAFLLTDEVCKAVEAEGVNKVLEKLGGAMKNLEQKTRGSDFLQIEVDGPKKRHVPKPQETPEDLTIVGLDCCDRSIRVKDEAVDTDLRCPYCGME